MTFSLSQIRNESRYMQYVATIIATLSMASTAMHIYWPSPSLPQLSSSDSPIGITITGEDGSWIVACFLLGSVVGGVLTAWLVEELGRKKTLLLSAIPLIVPWIGIIFVKSVLLLCIFRFIGGFALAIVSTSATIYIGEISEKDIRGKLGAAFNVLKLTGSLYTLCVGPFVSYTVLAATSCILPVIFAILFCFMPETPYYLIKTGRKDEARKNLAILASNITSVETIETQLTEIECAVECDMRNKSTLWEFLSKPNYRRSLIILAGIKTIQQLSGMAAIETYMQTIIGLTESSISPENSSIIAGLIQLPAAIIAGVLVDKIGRKPLMIISCSGCAIALIGEGVYFYLQEVTKAEVSYISWVPTTCLLLYLVMNPLGIFTLPYVLLGEMFATNIKGIAVALASIYGSLLAFFVTKFFQPISSQWGSHVTFWIFAGVCVFGIFFSLFVQPETKGNTLAEIQQKLNSPRKPKRNVVV